jgi:superfamily I DNA/RNA helicase
MKLTPEQAAARDEFAAGKNLVVQAGAGSGKSSTLREAAKAVPRRQGRVLMFNSANAKEAKRTFPPNVRCSTIHGQAWHIGRKYDEYNRVPLVRQDGARGGARRQPGWMVADILRITHKIECDKVPIEPRTLGRLAIETVDRWCLGIDPEITTEHVPWQRTMTPEGNAELAEHVVRWARKAWQDIMDLSHGQLNCKHDHYLRMWWNTGRAYMKTDFIMLDEAQDSNKLAAAIVQRQTHAQLIAVGDSAQAISSWRGATDALETWPADVTLWLTQSFRFGERVAEWANMMLSLIGAPLRLRGTPSIASTVGPLDLPRAVLCRTNAGAVSAAIKALDAGRKAALANGGTAIREFAEAAAALQAGERTAHPDLFAFPDWPAVQKYVDEDPAGGDLAALVRLAEEHGPAELVTLVDSLTAERDAEVTMSTVHGAKGLEWDSVLVGDDFAAPGWREDEDGQARRKPVETEAGRLMYVAMTRPRLRLGPGGLGWVPEWAADPNVVPGRAVLS